MELEEEMLEYLRERYGLDEPIYIQYAKWMAGVVRWDFGRSLEYKRPVSELLNERLAMTILLTTFTVMFTWTLAIPIGILSAVRQYSVLDYFFTFTSYVGVGTPNFVLALLLMYLAFDWFDLNVTGLFSQEYFDAPWSVGRIIDMLKHLWLPMIILGTDGMAGLTRVVPSEPAGRAQQALRRDGQGQGAGRVEGHPQVPGTLGDQPLRQRGRLDPAAALLRQSDRRNGHEPADDWAPAAEGAAGTGHVHGRIHPLDPSQCSH